MKNSIKLKRRGLMILIGAVCLFMLSQTGFARQIPPDNGLLDGKGKTLIKPAYPETAKKAGIGGEVKVNVTVDEQGNVIKAEVVSGETVLRDSALAAARASKFYPNTVSGKAVKMSGILFFYFYNSNSTTDSSTEGAQRQFFDYLNSDKLDWEKLNKDVEELNKADAGVNQDIFEFEKDPDFLGRELNKIGTKKASGNSCSDDRGLSSYIQFEIMTAPNKWEWVSVDRLKEYIKICDETIKENPNQSLPYYTRGLSRYYLIRGFEKPLIKTLADTESVSSDDLRLALADLQIFIRKQIEFNNKRNDGLSSEELKMAYLAAGELTAVTGVKGNSADLINSAINLWTAGEKLKTLSSANDAQKNKVMAADHDVVNQILAEASKPENNSPVADDWKARYKKYAAEYSSKESVYRQNLLNFQTALKAQQTAATPDNAQVCQSLAPMNASFQSLKNSFAPIVAMKTKGELTDPNLISQVETRDAQYAKIQMSINAAAKYGCQLK